ncbi:ATPase, T2SS/T4P/T4SS family, partial [Citrobacter europaeus]
FQSIGSRHSIIVQSQIPTHFADFYEANREAMRRKPGLIMIGEMRDEETIRAAIEASLTGHPAFGTVHATNVAAVARRLISRFDVADRATAIYDIV